MQSIGDDDMSSTPWVRWFPSDYKAKTQHLTWTEDLAYRRLLDFYYSSGKPLPADPERLRLIAGAKTKEQIAAVAKVAREFFTNGGGVMRQQRADEEIAEYERWLAGKRRAAKARWDAHPEQLQSSSNAGAEQVRSISPPPPPPTPPINTRPTPLASSDESLSAGGPGEGQVYIPLIGSKQWRVSPQFIAELELAYPDVDVPTTLKQIRAWCIANPSKRKTERGVMRFINRWCEKDQNHG